MGFDLSGENPKNKDGYYFRNNVWYWMPLWVYVNKTCSDILTEEDKNAGNFNDGHLINGEKTKIIGLRLDHLIEQRKVKECEKNYMEALKSVPDETCRCCQGQGIRDNNIKGECNVCRGTGKVRPSLTRYPFSEENVKEFANFCINSGGFRIF